MTIDVFQDMKVRLAVTISAKAVRDPDERQRAEDSIAMWLAGIVKAALPMCFEGPYKIEGTKDDGPQ